MVTEDQLRALLSDLESDRVERTIAMNNMEKFCEAVCAFANDYPNHRLPGYLIAGGSASERERQSTAGI